MIASPVGAPSAPWGAPYWALSASLQPYAGLAEHTICEYPFAPKALRAGRFRGK